MSSTPSNRQRWTGFKNRGNTARRERGRVAVEIAQQGSGSESEFAAQDRDLLNPTPQSSNDSQNELLEMTARREAALERQQETAKRLSHGRRDRIDEESLATELTDVPLDDSEVEAEEFGASQQSAYFTPNRRTRSPSPFHGVLDLGRSNGMASSTFLEDSCRHRRDFLDPEVEELQKDEEYEMLVHSDVWSDTDLATRRRALRSRYPPAFRNLRTEVQEDNRRTAISFDDALLVSSEPSSPSSLSPPGADQWDGWFLSDTPQETYPFENDYPMAAPLLRKIIALPRNKKVELMTAAAAGTWRELAAGLDKAVRMGRLVVDGVTLNARDLREIAEERVLDWAPGLFEAMWNLATGPFLPGAGGF